jgi:osmotically-inducible protein OsmY
MNTPLRLTPIALLAAVSLSACDKPNEPVPTARNTTRSTGRSETSRTVSTPPAPAPDNSAANKGDGASAAKTPMDQSQSSADIKVTADIRRAILDDKAMSTNAQNCKIITEKSGMVTLRGVVNSQAEKDSIESKAKAVAGVVKVDNQLEVKTN